MTFTLIFKTMSVLDYSLGFYIVLIFLNSPLLIQEQEEGGSDIFWFCQRRSPSRDPGVDSDSEFYLFTDGRRGTLQELTVANDSRRDELKSEVEVKIKVADYIGLRSKNSVKDDWRTSAMTKSKGRGLQRFDKQPEYSEVNPGEDIKLDCKVLNKKGSCSWQKDNKPVGIYIKKYEWAGSQDAGDCSLWVRAATLEFDDGEWECQVTASDFTTQDALTSAPVRLVVRVAPQKPRIEYKSLQVLPGNNVTGRAGDMAIVKCLSRYGNPPAKLKWFIGESELVGNQSNSPEVDNPRTWVASSALQLNLEKNQFGKNLRCVAIHESYPTKAQSVDVRLDVTYAPEVRLVGAPSTDLEEHRDTVVLKCVTDANPPASVVWRRTGRTDIASLEESLSFRPVTRRDSGTYTCQARNAMGASEPITVSLDIKFAPVIRSVGPERQVTVTLFGEASLDCEAEANPTPTYQWIQQASPILVRSNDARLHIRNVTYHHQGQYICRVSNYIGNKERSVHSDPVTLKVVGGPQVLRQSGGTEVLAVRGEDATLVLVVCADPRPKSAAWEWGSLHLNAGEGLGRYQAEQLKQDTREDCYEAKLHVREVDPADSRTYFLVVENERGIDKHFLRLAVRGSYANEPLAMMTVVSLVGVCLSLFLVFVLCGIYCARTEKCCFSRRGDFHPTDLESEKSDMESAMVRKGGGGGMVGPGVLPPDYHRRPHSITAPSPDAMKQCDEERRKRRGRRREPNEIGHPERHLVNHHSPGGLYHAKPYHDPHQYFCPAPPPSRSFAYDQAYHPPAPRPIKQYYQPDSLDKAEI